MNSVLAYVSESDFRVSGKLIGWRPPRWFRLWMLWATRLGDGWVWLLAGLVLLAGGASWLRVFAAAAVSSGIANAALVVMKRRFRRRRPCAYAMHPLFDVRPLGYFAADCFSFPSGHALNAFAIGTPIALQFPAAAPALFVIGASVAVSRVVLGLHFLSDVVAGSALGVLIGGLCWRAIVG